MLLSLKPVSGGSTIDSSSASVVYVDRFAMSFIV